MNHFQRSMDANKKRFRSLFLLLFLLVPIGKLSAAEELFFEGNARFAEEKYAEAAELYEQALEKSSSANLYYNAGLAALKLGDSGKARLQWERALRLEPRHLPARNSLRQLLEDLDLSGKEAETA